MFRSGDQKSQGRSVWISRVKEEEEEEKDAVLSAGVEAFCLVCIVTAVVDKRFFRQLAGIKVKLADKLR